MSHTHGPDCNHQPHIASRKVGRNEKCPCGSEVKYKKCCGSLVNIVKDPTPQEEKVDV